MKKLLTLSLLGLLLGLASAADDVTPPVVNSVDASVVGTIVYTFNEPIQLRNNDGTLISASNYESYLAIYVVSGGDYSLATKVSNDVTSAVLSSGGTVLTIMYDGSLVNKTDTSYVVDARGYRITDTSNNKVAASASQIFTISGDSTGPTATVSHNATTRTIVYTFNEPIQLRNNDGTLISASDYKSYLAIYVVSGGNYSLATQTSNGIISAILSNGGKTMTIVYSGSLVNKTATSYVVDARGYRITDALNNQMVASTSQIFTVDGKSTLGSGNNNSIKKIRWNQFNDDLNKVLKFLDLKSMSKADKKTSLKIILQTRRDLKSIYKQMKTEYLSGKPLDLSGYINQLTNEFTDFATQLQEYVSDDKQDDLAKYIQDKVSKLTDNLGNGLIVKKIKNKGDDVSLSGPDGKKKPSNKSLKSNRGKSGK